MIKLLFLTLAIFAVCHVDLSFSDNSCRLDDKPKLRIVFVTSYSLNRGGHWTLYQNQTAGHLVDYLKQDFPETEFAVTGYQDYPDSAKPQPRVIKDEDHCYFFVDDWSSDKNRIVKSISKNFGRGLNYDERVSDFADSVTVGLLNTAVEKKLNWEKGFVNKEGKTVRNIMVLFANRFITKVLKAPGNRTRPKADGTDTCQNALPPPLKQLSNVLYETGFTLINAMLNSAFGDESIYLEKHYEKEFASLLIPYYSVPFPGPNIAAIDKNYGKEYKTYAKKIFDIIKQEVMICDWEDPKGYNSLGL